MPTMSVARRIAEFAAMSENWDGYGALAIRPETVQNAIKAVSLISYPVDEEQVTPNPNGTISIEWQSAHGSAHLEIGQTRYSLYILTSHEPILADGPIDKLEAVLAADRGRPPGATP